MELSQWSRAPNVKINVDKNGKIIEKPDFTKADKNNGLTPWGFELLEAMEYLGIIPDVSHLSDAGFYDVLKHSKKPFVASHSNARSICNHVRNMDDEMIKLLANKGGVMGINFVLHLYHQQLMDMFWNYK